MCGGFTCSKNALTALNILYVLVAFILIGVAVYGRASAFVTNLPIIGGILACGIILIIISILGLIGAIKHHQVILFFYMLILFLLFLVQFSVACACLAVNMDQQRQLTKQGWSRVDEDLRSNVQQALGCCGYSNETAAEDNLSCPASCSTSPCPHCMDKLQDTIKYAFKLCGGIGLFFSFTEVISSVIAYRFRNQVNPDTKAASDIFPNRRKTNFGIRNGSRLHYYT